MAKTDDTEQTKNPAQTNETTDTGDIKETAAGSNEASLTGDAPDPKTDAAVEDIMKSDGDAVLQAQDAAAEAVVMKLSPWERFKNGWRAWWANPKKRYLTLGTMVVLVGVVFAVPVTRYDALGLVLKKPVTIRTVDSKTGAPVSGVTVMLAGKTAETDANGLAILQVPLGSKTLEVAKSYYKGTTTKQLVTLSASHNSFKASLTALGRQVRVKVVDKVSGKPVSGATVIVGNAKAKTDASGGVTVVTPVSNGTQAATVSVKGYNDVKVSIVVGGDLAKNTFAVLPSGKLYFLSNLSGRIDVVKTNLDGTDRQVVLEGTGSEDRYSTSLLASRDWKYLALLAKRSGKTASVYLIDTTNGDKLTTVDEGDARFSFVGWSGDHFVYQVDRNLANGQKNAQVLKSLDPTTGQTLLLDQTDGATYHWSIGSSSDPNNDPNSAYYTGYETDGYVEQTFGGVYLVGNSVVYIKNWEGSGVRWTKGIGMVAYVSGRSAELDTIGADGTGHKSLKTFMPSGVIIDSNIYPSLRAITVDSHLYEPSGIYLSFTDGSSTMFSKYENGNITSSGVTSDDFYSTPYLTYLLSPSGNSTFWSDQRDGKNTLFTGDQNGDKSKQIATLSDYNTYGWYTDNYLLVSKNSSELYIIGKDGGTPLKITDYYKPSINYQGYGGGYGGL